MSDWDDDEPIGYGRPPKWTRFPEGQSGNPTGRPKKARPKAQTNKLLAFDSVLLKEIDEKIRVTENGKVRKISKLEAIVKAHLNNGIGGNAAAQRDFARSIVEAMQRQQQSAEAEVQAEQKQAERDAEIDRKMFDYYARLKRARQKEWDQALANGKSEPDFPWPHPDDILLDMSRKRYRVRGPIDDTHVRYFLWHKALRDLYFVKTVIAIRSSSKSDEGLSSFWNRLWVFQDVQLPKRWQIGDRAEVQMFRMDAKSMRDLRRLEAVHEEAASSWEARLGTPESSRFASKITAQAFDPIVRRYGYRSFRQFKRAMEDTGGNAPWPRKAQSG